MRLRYDLQRLSVKSRARWGGRFSGEVIDTRDVITFQGTLVEDLKQAFEDSVDDYLEFCALRGENPKKYSLDELVAKITPQNRHEEMDWGAPTPKEQGARDPQ